MMNRIIGILVGIVVLTGASLVALLVRERNQALEQSRQAEDAGKQLESELQTLRSERDSLRKLLPRRYQPVPEIVAPAVTQGAPAAAAPAGSADAKPAAPAKDARKAMVEMLKNPAMKEMMKQQQVVALDMQYGGLFSQYHFGDGEKAEFKQLLADRLLQETELGLKMLEDINPDQRQALAKEIEETRKNSDERIRYFLNSDADYATFKRWEDTKGERMQLDRGRSSFANAGEPLTPQQEQQLVDTMHQVNSLPSPVPDLSKPKNFDPVHLTQADIERQLAHYDATTQAVASRAAQFLSPKQVETLRTLQQQWRSMSETGLKMSSIMFGEQKQPAK